MALPPFSYYGGKTTIAPKIVQLLPPHQHYVEPFAGSLAVLLANPTPAKFETVNDLDGEIVNFWRVLRDQPDELARVCACTPHARGELAAAQTGSADDDVERARRMWGRISQGRGATGQRTTGWRYFARPDGSSVTMPGYLSAYVDRIGRAAARLARVSLECRDAFDVIADYGQHAGVLLYVDPPYLADVRSSLGYTHEMADRSDHARLLDVLAAARAAVVLSGYADAMYDEALSSWHRVEIDSRSGNASASAQHRCEVLWMNRAPAHRQAQLFLDAEFA